MPIQLPGHPRITPTQASNQGIPPTSGGVPAAFPRYFSFGVMNGPGNASLLATMRSQNGTAYAFRYQYLSAGVNTHAGWETWNTPTGQFVTNYMQESAQYGYTPAFVYYEICQSNGPHPGSYCSGHDLEQDTANLANPSTMNAYYANWVLLLQKIQAFGKPVLVIVEPDLWGFLQKDANGSDNAANLPASVSSSGYADAAGFPNTAQGFGWALLHMRDKYAPRATLAVHASLWATNTDIGSDTSSSLDLAGLAQREAKFLASTGLTGTPAGVSSWDLISNDVADHDAGQLNGHAWWDRYNHTFPNFARYLQFISLLSQDAHRRIVMWQVPIGNQYFDTMNNSAGHYQDNRAEYILSNVASFARAGIIGVLFGPGNGGTTFADWVRDGITNPAPISTYECNFCNNHRSQYADDDGGYLRIFVGQYMRHPLGL
ncbi:MAG TPA: hypothetical protein VEU97_07325 [Ktedonobacteraceae bacterium]|nr:hypothetical protein [Ktedonobacteraceae bacterium]